MVASDLASPLCTWLVAACMSVSFEKDHTPRRLGQWTKRKKFVSKCINRGGAYFVSNKLTNGSGIQTLINSCLTFEPCNEFNNSKGQFTLLGSPTAWTRKQRSMNHPAAHSGN
ncbi:hypothetical protein CMV_030697 [Castanea mollissima]|uniref:Uncharacterized protein n=1 Tax=Castanea mollissima TaxID=60419 RepID=A0A8J4V661_9ROSI|nr:hypothetical protein CMV_030697 [Castanea mollissima]